MLTALGLGVLGGLLFAMLRLPLPWMLGPLLANLVAQGVGVRVFIPQGFRSASHVVLGLVLGATFSPEVLTRIQEWPFSLAGLGVFTILATAGSTWFYRNRGLDPVTALFAATPGVMAGMIVMGAEAGGDERRIALIQSLRVAMVVVAVPPLVTALSGAGAVGPAQNPTTGPTAGWDLLLLFGVAAAVTWCTVRLRLPSAYIIGTMVASAVMHIGGWVTTPLPDFALDATLLVLGASIGTRFAGVTWRDVVRIFFLTLAVVSALLVCSLLGAMAFHQLLGLDFWAALLAFAPGGVAEMCAIALALNIDPAFVAFHHLFRIALIVLLMPLVLVALRKSRGT